VIPALVSTTSAVYLLKRRALASRALVLGAVFLAGALTIQVRGSSDSGPVWLGVGEEVLVSAHVVAEGNVQLDGPAELHQRVDVETEKIESAASTSVTHTSAAQTFPAQPTEVHAGVRLNIYSRIEGSDSPQAPPAGAMQLFRYGQRIRFPGNSDRAPQLPQSWSIRLRGIFAGKRDRSDRFDEVRGHTTASRIFRELHYAWAGSDPPQRHRKSPRFVA